MRRARSTTPNELADARSAATPTPAPAAVNPDALQVLVVDDEQMMRDLLCVSLRRLGYSITAADNGLHALDLFHERHFDLLILDVMMPGMDGFQLCAEVRKRSAVPIIMLTALSRPDDVVRGLELGADNYITKPFTFKEVEAKIQAIMRRLAQVDERPQFTIMQHGDITINDDSGEVTIGTQPVRLTRTEYQLLRYMMTHADELVPKEDLLQDVWGYGEEASANLVELAVGRLRKKIEEDPAQPQRLVTVRGFGYKLLAATPADSAADSPSNVSHRTPSRP